MIAVFELASSKEAWGGGGGGLFALYIVAGRMWSQWPSCIICIRRIDLPASVTLSVENHVVRGLTGNEIDGAV